MAYTTLHPLERTISIILTLFESVARFTMTSTFLRVGSTLLELLMDPVPLTGTKMTTKRTTILLSPLTTIPSIPCQLKIPSLSFAHTHLLCCLHLHLSNLLVTPSFLKGQSHSRSHLNAEKGLYCSMIVQFWSIHFHKFHYLCLLTH